MKKTSCKRGFTLIELLVVVLIIGILAAVAVPQYQKAVEKSRAMQALTLLKSVYQAAKSYQLTNGTWPTQFEELDVDIPWEGNTPFVDTAVMTDTRSNDDWSIQLYFADDKHHGVWIGRMKGNYQYTGFAMFNAYDKEKTDVDSDRIVCVENVANFEEAGGFCQKLFHATLRNTGGYRYYQMP